MDFTGTWEIVSSPDFDDEYLHLVGAPYVALRQNDGFVKGVSTASVSSAGP